MGMCTFHVNKVFPFPKRGPHNYTYDLSPIISVLTHYVCMYFSVFLGS